MSSSSEVLTLYKSMLRQASRFSGYNFRNYAFRKVRDEFIRHRFEADPAAIRQLLQKGNEQLAILSRQGAISQMYGMPDLVVEK